MVTELKVRAALTVVNNDIYNLEQVRNKLQNLWSNRNKVYEDLSQVSKIEYTDPRFKAIETEFRVTSGRATVIERLKKELSEVEEKVNLAIKEVQTLTCKET